MKDEMFFGEPPEFDDLIRTARKFQDEFNQAFAVVEVLTNEVIEQLEQPERSSLSALSSYGLRPQATVGFKKNYPIESTY